LCIVPVAVEVGSAGIDRFPRSPPPPHLYSTAAVAVVRGLDVSVHGTHLYQGAGSRDLAAEWG